MTSESPLFHVFIWGWIQLHLTPVPEEGEKKRSKWKREVPFKKHAACAGTGQSISSLLLLGIASHFYMKFSRLL